MNFNEDQYDKIRTIGSSTFTKALTMPIDELNDLISWAKSGKTNAEIVTRVESYMVPSIHWVADATYVMGINQQMLLNRDMIISIKVFTEKSSESEVQKYTWSAQKHTHLLKLHLQCSTRGRIISASGLWGAADNDASILKCETENGEIYYFLLRFY